MALTVRIANHEISSNPATGKVTGDVDPATTQTGVLPKLRKADGQCKEDLEDTKDVLDDHNHDPGTADPGGPPIGLGPDDEIVRALVDGAIIEDLIAPGAITGTLTDGEAIDDTKIEDESVTKDELGTPGSVSHNIAPGSSWTWTHGKGSYLVHHVEANSPDGEWMSTEVGFNTITVSLDALANAAVDATIRYWG